MKKNSLYIRIFILLFIEWIIFFENISPTVLVLGFFTVLFSIIFTHIYLKDDITDTYLSYTKIFLAYFYTLASIYMSALRVSGIILSKSIKSFETEIVEIPINIKGRSRTAILSNSITLSPGTITIETGDDYLRVLKFKNKGFESVYPKRVEKLLR